LRGNANAVTALSTLGLLLFTIVLVFIAFKTFKSTEKYNRLQAIKDTIFKLIDFHYKNFDSISVRGAGLVAPNSPNTVTGAKAFESMYEDLVSIYKNIDAAFYENDEEEIIKVAFYDLYKKNSQIGNYYKNLYLLVEYIDIKGGENIEGFDTQYYIRLIKAQLSKYELLMLAYNCIWIYGETGKKEDKEFLKLAERFKLRNYSGPVISHEP
jgi:hypothetical protein